MVYGLNFGSCLTIAIVHSLDVARYSYNLLVYAAWCELAAAVWLIEAFLVWFHHRQTALLPTAAAKTAPKAPEPA